MAKVNSNIANFRSNFQGGTRPNRFLVEGGISQPGGAVYALSPFNFLVKATTLPASTIGVIPVPYRGRVLKIPGDRMFAEWAITIIDDGDTSIKGEGADMTNLRSEFTRWSNAINSHVGNVTEDPNMSTLAQTWHVSMLSQKNDKKIRTISMHNCWPIEIAAVDLSYDSADTITEFQVNMAYDFWTEKSTKGGGDITDQVNTP
jgi:hypothetical protein